MHRTILKNHLKSQTHTSNTHKRQQTTKQFKCDFFDIDMQNVTRNIYLKSLKYKKSLREKYIINTPKFFGVDKILSDYVEGYNKNFGIYFINCEYKLKLNNNSDPHIEREYFYSTDLISMKRYLLYWIDYFMSRGYQFCKINERLFRQLVIDVI